MCVHSESTLDYTLNNKYSPKRIGALGGTGNAILSASSFVCGTVALADCFATDDPASLYVR